MSYNYGARDYERVRRTFKLVFALCVLSALSTGAVMMLFPQVFAGVFTRDKDTLSFASWALRIYLSGTIIFGAQMACQQSFMALGQAKVSLLMAVNRKIILLIPLIYILPNFFTDKTFAVFLAEPVADLLAVCTTGVMFFFQFRRSMGELEAKAA